MSNKFASIFVSSLMSKQHFSIQDIEAMQKLYRINLINSCTGYKPANLIGTKSKSGQENLALHSSVVHLGSTPPYIGFIMRPLTEFRHTFENLVETGSYTINHIFDRIIVDAHHTSAKYPKEISEFDQTDLEPEYKNDCYAPFVQGSPVQIEMQYVNQMPIEENGTILIIGKIKNIYVQNQLLCDDGSIDLSKGNIATITGLDTYSIPKAGLKFPYQHPKSKKK